MGTDAEKAPYSLNYQQAGVDTEGEESALEGLLGWIRQSFALRKGAGSVKLPIGYFANVIDVGYGLGLAISTDGVGTKLLVAQMMDKYDTVGIDCVAMNVNDVLCVGAEPISMVDYIAVEEPIPSMLEGIARGLYEGARLANITISGGEIAQLREMLRGARKHRAFDLAGTCVGLVPLDRVIVGQSISAGDVVVGLRSSGIHSNGLTLARRVLFDQARLSPHDYVDELGRTLGEELLEPTRIYVPEVLDILRSGVDVKALAHITSDGLLNLTRVERSVGYIIEYLPEPHPIFALIQRLGHIADEEMYRVFNMGIGFCIVVSESDSHTVQRIARKHGVEAFRLGYAVDDSERRVILSTKDLIGRGSRFARRV